MIILLILTSLLGQFAGYPALTDEGLIDGLEYGSYAVGVRFEHLQDASRTISVGSEQRSRPIQITIWYPAISGESEPKMSVADYLGYKASEFLPENSDATARSEAIERSKENMIGAGASRAEIGRIYEKTTHATLNAAPASEKFPLLIYAPSFDESPSENIVLCEYLASHGYIVASCPSSGAESREMTSDADGIRAQAADLAFVLNRMEKSDQINFSNVGTLGFSWGGLANVLFALEHGNIKAVASMDGSIAVPVHRALVSSIAELDSKRLHVPFIYLASYRRQFEKDPHDYFFIDAADKAERYLIRLHDLGHGNFSSSYVAALPYFSDEVRGEMDPKRAEAGYRAACFYLLNFFNAYLNGDPAAKELFSQKPESNGFDENLLTIKRW